MKPQCQHELVLASGSPRRRELLREAGYDFRVVVPSMAEPPLSELAESSAMTPVAVAEYLAGFKADAVAGECPEAVVLAADTIVVHGKAVVGKPADLADARRMLTELFAGESQVITGVCVRLAGEQRRECTHAVTTLMMHPMSEPEVEAYLRSGAWQGKAGGYAIQEGGDRFVKELIGSETNVVGLPLELVGDLLGRFGCRPARSSAG